VLQSRRIFDVGFEFRVASVVLHVRNGLQGHVVLECG
jgi:hypothetical protein